METSSNAELQGKNTKAVSQISVALRELKKTIPRRESGRGPSV